MPTKADNMIATAGNVIHRRSTRNFLFLILSVVIILAINSLLPLIEGGSHYTEAAVDYTYAEYKELVKTNKNYNLTWKSAKDINNYKETYKQEHPELTTEEYILLEPPEELVVQVYTKYFFQHAYWWLATLIHIISVLLVYYSVFNYIIYKRKQTDQRYLDLQEEVNKAIDQYLEPSTFEPWLETFNYERKYKQYVSNIKYKLDKLERKTSYKIKHDETCKAYSKYIDKKQKLTELISEPYIEKYLPTLKVKNFNYIYPTFVNTGYNGIGHTEDVYSLIKSDAKKLSNDSLRKTISTLFITVLFAVIITFTVTSSLNSPWYIILLNVLFKIAPLAIQIPQAFDYCEAFMEDQLITNLMHRRSISLLYLASTHKEVQDANKNTNEC